MKKYNFDYLTWFDFENLSRDIIEAREAIDLEGFSDGPDGGIDFRKIYSKDDILIVQSKHYQSYKSLLGKLKLEELPKIKKLNPSRYILVTSINMSPSQKREVSSVLRPYLLSEADIVCAKDIEQIIDGNEAILKKNHKLWFTSSVVLEMIMQKKIIGRSNQLESDIRSKAIVYVETGNVDKTLEVLNKNNYVIISGAPGIGKTTLAQIVSLYHVKDGYELAYVTNIDEAEEIIDESRKQIIYYDDFLGKNFLKSSPYRNEDKRLVNLLNRINATQKTKLIMTTREYILRQAQSEYDELDGLNVTVSKILIELSNYSLFQKGHILYNHLYYSTLEKPFLEDIVRNRNYMRIIEHRNYNPRLIEAMTNSTMMKPVDPENFTKEFIAILNNPIQVWSRAFEQHISEGARILLFALLSCPQYVQVEVLQNIFNEFTKAYSTVRNLNIGSADFNTALKELDGTFIRVELLTKNRYVTYHNPSIIDFLISYIANDELIQSTLICSSVYLNPLLEIFSFKEERGKVKISNDLGIILANKIVNNFRAYMDVGWDNSKAIIHMYELTNFFEFNRNEDIDKLLKETISQIEYPSAADDYEFSSYLSVRDSVGLNDDAGLSIIALSMLKGDIFDVADLKKITYLYEFHASITEKVVEENSIDIEQIFRDTLAGYSLEDMDSGELEVLLDDVIGLEIEVSFSLRDEREMIERAVAMKSGEQDEIEDVSASTESPRDNITELFESLLTKSS